MRTRSLRTVAAIGATALALTACGGGGGGTPEEVVANGLAARFDNGAAFTLSIEGDLEELEERFGEEAPPEAAALFNEGLIRGAMSEDGFALAIGPGAGFVEIRAIDETLYFRVDLDALADFSADMDAQIPDRATLQAQVDQFGLSEELTAVTQTALDGGWVGVTGLSEEALESLAEDFGMSTGEPAEGQEEQARAILEGLGFLDGETFTERYLIVEGDGPTYDVTIKARALVAAFVKLTQEIQESLGAAAMMAPEADMPDPADVPEEISGITVTVENGKLTRVAGDIAAIGQSAGEDTGELQVGDLAVVLALEDIGSQLDVPADAQTVSFDQLLQAAMAAMFSGGLGGLDDLGDVPDLSDLEDLGDLDPDDLAELEELLDQLPDPS